MRIRSPFDDISVSPEMTSLIDIMFLLVIFFMLTSTFESKGQRRHVPVELPQAQYSQPVHREDAVSVAVDAKGGYSLGDQPCPAADLAEALGARIALARDSVVIISAHRDAPYGSVVLLYDVLQSLGVRRFSHEVR